MRKKDTSVTFSDLYYVASDYVWVKVSFVGLLCLSLSPNQGLNSGTLAELHPSPFMFLFLFLFEAGFQ